MYHWCIIYASCENVVPLWYNWRTKLKMLYHWCIINERKKWLKNRSQMKTLYHWGTIHSRWDSPRNQYQIKTLYHWCIIYERRKWLNNRSQRKHGTVEEQYTPGGYVLKTKIKSEIHVVPLMCNLGKKETKEPTYKKVVDDKSNSHNK